MDIRPTLAADIPAMEVVLDATGLFPSEMLADMIAGYLADQVEGEIWLSCDVDGVVQGFCYARAEALTDGTWNMLAIAVAPSCQGLGCGGAICARLEATLASQGQRILIADTSGTDDFQQARAFYAKQGYSEEARIRDFWQAGDDKVTFRKALT